MLFRLLPTSVSSLLSYSRVAIPASLAVLSLINYEHPSLRLHCRRWACVGFLIQKDYVSVFDEEERFAHGIRDGWIFNCNPSLLLLLLLLLLLSSWKIHTTTHFLKKKSWFQHSVRPELITLIRYVTL